MSGVSAATIATIVGATVAAAGVGVSLYEMANQPGAGAAPQAPSQSTIQTQQAEAQQAAALSQAQALQKRRGMASTILTSPMGTSGGPAQGQSATLGT
jgi:hypothetical protein